MFKKALILSLLSVIGLVIVAKLGAESWAQSYLSKAAKVPVAFRLVGLSPYRLELKDLVVGESNKIKRLQVEWDLPFALTKVIIEIDHLDIASLKQMSALHARPSGHDDSEHLAQEKADLQQQAIALCKQIEPLNLEIHLKTLAFNEQLIPVDLRIHHEVGEKTSKITAKELYRSKSFRSSKGVAGQVACLDDGIELLARKLTLQGQTPPSLRRWDVSFNQLLLSLTDKILVQAKAKVSLSAQLKDKEEKKLTAVTSNIAIHASSPKSLNISEMKAAIKLEDLLIEGTQSIKSPSSSLFIDFTSGDFSKPSIAYDLLQVELQKDGEHQAGPLNFKGGINISSNYKATTTVSDEERKVRLKDIAFIYNTKTKNYRVTIPKNSIDLQYVAKLKELFPVIGKDVESGSGKVHMEGYLRSSPHPSRLRFSGTGLNLAGPAVSIKDLQIDHTFLDIDNFTSLPQRMELIEFQMGPKIENLEVSYQIKDLANIFIKHLDFKYAGASIRTSNTRIDSVSMTTDLKKINVRNFDLQHLLQLALKDDIKALGKLDGDIKIRFAGKKPLIEESLLTAKGKGWIRYRPPGMAAPSTEINPEDFSKPVDALKNYLYDFHYDQLTVSVRSDESFQTDLTLRALGSNPNYLNGKRLELNVNLDLNILDAIKSVMMTYNLPENIKNKMMKSRE